MTSAEPRSRGVLIVGLLLALAAPLLGHYAGPWIGPDRRIGTEIFFWGLFVLVLGYVLVVERRRLGSIGLRRPTWKTFATAIPAAILMVVGFSLIYTVVFPALGLTMNTAEMHKLMDTPYWYRVLLVTRAGFMEETLFRGYGIERLSELTGKRWIGAVITWAAFTFAHLNSWGWAQLIIAGYGGVVLTTLYLWRRDLACNILAHWLTDGAGFLLPH